MRKENIIKILLVIILLFIILIVAFWLKTLNTEIIENHSFYQYFFGKKVEYDGNFKLTRKNDITELEIKDKQIQLDSTPIYYKDIENQVIFPEDMAIVYPLSSGLMYKINRFSNMKLENETVYLKNKEQEKSLQNSFLFDGNDLYFFLENTQIEVNGSLYELSPLSYAIVRYGEGIEIYNKQQDSYSIIETQEDIYAKTADYTINMSIDSINYKDKDQLLIKKIEYLQNIEM